MISLTRINGSAIAVDPSLIAWIDLAADTVVSLVGGDRIVVQESLDDIVERITVCRAGLERRRAGDLSAWDARLFTSVH